MTSGEFTEQTGPFRGELLAHCYRMLGSADEAEDLVQETYLRAWRAYGTFEGRSSVRTWLYRIATNACLNALEQRGRRALPSGLGGPSGNPDAPPGAAEPGLAWLQPVPDTLVIAGTQDPAAIVAAREGVRLALIASLQYLPPRQRAVLLLREALGVPAAEVAAMLGTSAVAVKSMLQRARARLDEAAPALDDLIEPGDPRARELLGQYIAGFEHADLESLEKALRADAAIEMTGSRTWFSGRVTCLRYLAHVIGSAGDWRMTATAANGQPAAAAYYRDGDGGYQALGVAVLGVTTGGIARITVFGGGAGLVARFGFPAAVSVLAAQVDADRARVHADAGACADAGARARTGAHADGCARRLRVGVVAGGCGTRPGRTRPGRTRGARRGGTRRRDGRRDVGRDRHGHRDRA